MFTNTTVLEGLFESRIKVKLIKIFLRNKEQHFTLDEIIDKTKEDSSSVRYQLKKLIGIGFVRSILTDKLAETIKPSEQNQKVFAKPRRFFVTNRHFEFIDDLEHIFSRSTAIDKTVLVEKLNAIGKIKLLLLSGIFIDREGTRVDMLIVGDGVNDHSFDEMMRTLEDEVGKDIRYSLLETREFQYRLDMFDNFLRSVLSEPSDVLIDKLGVKSTSLNLTPATN